MQPLAALQIVGESDSQNDELVNPSEVQIAAQSPELGGTPLLMH
ncbi:MAG: hypothetical protein ACRDJ2_16280 [Actinomycetota bacterium]